MKWICFFKINTNLRYLLTFGSNKKKTLKKKKNDKEIIFSNLIHLKKCEIKSNIILINYNLIYFKLFNLYIK